MNLDKVGEYTIDVLYNGSGYPLKVKVIDVENPTIHVEPFTIEQYENIIWDREMYNRIQLTVSDNATDENTLYNSIKVEGLDPSIAGEQLVTFTLKDASRNETSITVSYTHLDVYKRQGDISPFIMNELFKEGNNTIALRH